MSDRKWEELNQCIVHCRRCPRLVAWREEVAQNPRRAYRDWVYWGKPVPGFGDRNAALLVVGLAPGAHGSNRTGRMFTGDGSGDFLFPALYRAGFASQPVSRHLEDGMELRNMFIAALARCAPPKNRPATEEFRNCRPYLVEEINLLQPLKGIVALGGLAFNHVLDIYQAWGFQIEKQKFRHGVLVSMGNGAPWLLGSYHPSRQNTQTGRLTTAMFDGIWEKANSLLPNNYAF